MDFLDNTWTTIFVSIITIWALFGDDIRILAVDSNNDAGFYWATIACFVIFSIEILLSSYANDEYLNSFFFWLDLVSTATLLLDVGWISDAIFNSGSSGSSGNASQVAKAAKTSRIGTRAARIIRIIRLIRLIRIVKLYKAAEKERQRREEEEKSRKKQLKRHNDPNNHDGIAKDSQDGYNNQKKMSDSESIEPNNNLPPIKNNRNAIVPVPGNTSQQPQRQNKLEGMKSFGSSADLGLDSMNNQGMSKKSETNNKEKDDQLMEEVQESNVGKTLISNITKIVIVLILMIMFSIPIFSSSTYSTDDFDAQSAAIKQIERAISRYDTQFDFFNHTFHTVYDHFTTQSIPIFYGNVTRVSEFAPDTSELIVSKGSLSGYFGLRSDEILTQASDSDNFVTTNVLVGSVNTTYTWTVVLIFKNRNSSTLGAWLGIGRTIFVCFILTFFVLKLSKDSEILVIGPLEKMVKNVKKISMNPLEAAELEEKEAENRENLEKNHPELWQEYKEQNEYEPAMLEKIIVKIGTLLAIGFGEAGSDIIATNTREGGTVNPMLGGKKCVAIFGFCDIRAFAEITEVLKKDVMIFVNEIAEIVHNIVNEHQGAANKNIGEAFLLIWKIPDTLGGEIGETETQMEADPKSHKNKALADLAVLAFIRVLAGINRSKKLEKYTQNKELRERFNHEYKVNMGFGLHIGWGIEGAIGSKFKIDASYLSPNVNMSARLEAATRQFGVSILIRYSQFILVGFSIDTSVKSLRIF